MPQTAPFGTWVSSVTLDKAAGQVIAFCELRADAGAVFWLETRPDEAGRVSLMRRSADGAVSELTPAPFDVGNRVHEYGGGSYLAAQGRVLFSDKRDGALWLIEADGSPRLAARVPGCRYADFCLGPEGIFAFAVREDHRQAGPPKAAIVALDLSGKTRPEANEGKILVQGPDFLSSPRLSPDGRKLAWVSWMHPDMPWDASKLMLAPMDCVNFESIIVGTPRQMAGKMREAIVQPAWSPAGVLHFCTDRSGWWNIYRALEETSRICPVQGEIGGPHWNFGRRYFDFVSESTLLAVCVQDGVANAVRIRQGQIEKLPIGSVAEAPLPLPDGGMAYLSQPSDAPAAVMLLSGSGQRLAIRTAGTAGLQPEEISAGQSILFPLSAGLTGYGFWYKPVNPAWRGPPGELPPLIVMCHGGPTGMASPALSLKIQWWTSRGFAVLDMNYGGSTGFGRRYRERLERRWGVIDVADCREAARYMADAGYVDKRRIVIRGSSAGGFTALSAVAESDMFRAATSLYGVTDLLALAQETHQFESRYMDWLIGPLPPAELLYRSRSPVNRTDTIHCPVLFFQGLDDRIVPPSQARTMAEALRAKGLDAPLHEFPGEGHGFRQIETIRQVLTLETRFYGEVLGFKPVV